MWPSIRKQLQDGNEVIRLNFDRRKTNPNPFFTFAPAKLFVKWKTVEKMPFKTAFGKPVSPYILDLAFRNARKRAGIERKVTPHMFRDLLHTDGETELGISKSYLDFLTGHVVDRDQYTQLLEKPNKVLEVWKKWEAYADAGGPATATRDELESRDRRIAELEAQAKEQSAMLGLILKKMEGLDETSAELETNVKKMVRKKSSPNQMRSAA